MTTQQLYLFNGLYFAALVVVAFLTRATARRIAGALAGGAAFAVVALGIIALGKDTEPMNCKSCNAEISEAAADESIFAMSCLAARRSQAGPNASH